MRTEEDAITRRSVLFASAAVATRPLMYAAAASSIKAIALDAFTVLDPRPIAARAEELYPGMGKALVDLWRTRQFEYCWLRTLTQRYVDFWHITEHSLDYAGKALTLDLTSETKGRLTECFWNFQPWPDAKPALERLKAANIRLVFLSNFTESMLKAAVEKCRFEGLFEPHLSTDRVRAFKPDLRAYQMAIDALQLRREQIVFAAFAGWDAAGAKAFGFPTFWVNRSSAPVEELGIRPDATGKDLNDLATFIIGPGTLG